MADENELNAAVERLRRVKAGEDPVDVYGTRKRTGRVTLNSTWTFREAQGLAVTLMAEDYETLADAYLKLGTRQPDEQRVLAAGQMWDAEEIFMVVQSHHPDAKLMRVATFIQEIPEVPNAD